MFHFIASIFGAILSKVGAFLRNPWHFLMDLSFQDTTPAERWFKGQTKSLKAAPANIHPALLIVLEKKIEGFHHMCSYTMQWWIASVTFCGVFVAYFFSRFDNKDAPELETRALWVISLVAVAFVATLLVYAALTAWYAGRVRHEVAYILQQLGVEDDSTIYLASEPALFRGAIINGVTSYVFLLILLILAFSSFGRKDVERSHSNSGINNGLSIDLHNEQPFDVELVGSTNLFRVKKIQKMFLANSNEVLWEALVATDGTNKAVSRIIDPRTIKRIVPN